MKVAVYAICKDEEKFVDRWIKNLKEADGIFVLDTGSCDDTVSLLKKNGVFVSEEVIEPFRFDVARNLSLDLVPLDYDVCLCIDLDEVVEEGWRRKLEDIWDDNLTRLRYNYNWSLDDKGNPLVSFYTDKIHKRRGYKWTHPVHEVLEYDGDERIMVTDLITVNHYPDRFKSRASYLPLLELSVKEDPMDDRNMHYLGREYMFYGRYNEAIDTFIRHLSLESATWKDERCASMRFISRCYKKLEKYDEARMWLSLAKEEAPYLREPFCESGILEYECEDYYMASLDFLRALEITNVYKSYINESFCNDFNIYDMLSICEYNLKDKGLALFYINEALKIDCDNERLLNNRDIILNEINES